MSEANMLERQVSKKIDICEEDVVNLKECLERTRESWVYPIDLWVFTIQHIIKEWKSK